MYEHKNTNMTPNEIRILREKGRIPAIKEHRMRTGMGLKESKDIVDEYAEALGMMERVTCVTCNGKGTFLQMKFSSTLEV